MTHNHPLSFILHSKSVDKKINKVGTVFLCAIFTHKRELGLNKSALARRLNVSRAYVTKVFDGKANFTFASAYHFASALQMDFTPQLTIKPDEDLEESEPTAILHPSSFALHSSTPNLSTPAFAMA